MRSFSVHAMVISSVLLGAAPRALAELPRDRIERYFIHLNPAEPSSDIIWTVSLALSPVDANEGVVRWSIDSITVQQLGEESEVVKEWSLASPSLNTQDGYWHVAHADPSLPASAEFARPPRIQGVLTAVTGGEESLSCLLEGKPYSRPSSDPRWDGIVSAIDYSFTVEGNSDPDIDGRDEPVESGGGPDAPSALISSCNPTCQAAQRQN